MLWFKKKPKVDEEAESFRKRYETVENFANVGDFVEYLGVKMLVVGYHNWNPYYWNTPSLNVEWMDNCKRLQKNSIRDWELKLCKRISTSEEQGAGENFSQQSLTGSEDSAQISGETSVSE